jgi:hypothetical protein
MATLLNKDVLTQAEVLVALRTIAPQDSSRKFCGVAIAFVSRKLLNRFRRSFVDHKINKGRDRLFTQIEKKRDAVGNFVDRLQLVAENALFFAFTELLAYLLSFNFQLRCLGSHFVKHRSKDRLQGRGFDTDAAIFSQQKLCIRAAHSQYYFSAFNHNSSVFQDIGSPPPSER